MANTLPNGFKLIKAKEIRENLFGLHTTGSAEAAKSIAESGAFDLSKFGSTAKKFNAPSYLVENDPLAVFSSPIKELRGDNVTPGEGYVYFEVSPEANVLVHDMSGADAKKALREHFGTKTPKELTAALVVLGAHVIAPKDLDTEMIILRTNVIKLKEAGVSGDRTFPITDPYNAEHSASY